MRCSTPVQSANHGLNLLGSSPALVRAASMSFLVTGSDAQVPSNSVTCPGEGVGRAVGLTVAVAGAADVSVDSAVGVLAALLALVGGGLVGARAADVGCGAADVQ